MARQIGLGFWPKGWFSIRQRGTYFVMLTLAFSQMFYFIAYTATGLTGGDNGLMFGALGMAASAVQAEPRSDGTPLSLQDPADTPLVFAASTAPAPEVPQWELAPFHPDAGPGPAADDARGPAFASFDPVGAEHAGVPQWGLSEAAPHEATDTIATAVEDAGAGTTATFDPVAAEHEGAEAADEDVVFRFDADALDNADDVLSLQAMETLPLGDDAGPPPSLEIIDAMPPVAMDDGPGATGIDGPADAGAMAEGESAAARDVPPIAAMAPAGEEAATPAVALIDIDTIAPIDFSEADAQFFAELNAAAADFDPQAMAVPAVPEQPAEAGFDAGFDDDAENIDEDIREVFLEEFDDELANLGTLLPAWRVQPDNLDRLRPIRRVFHTLKGSGRLVGARTLGEFAWKIEGMLNRVLDGSRPASPAVLSIVDHAYAALPQLNAALRHGQRISVDLQAMQAIADRVGAGEDAFYVPLPGAATPAVPAAGGDEEIERILEAEAAAAAGDGAEPASEAAGTPASIDSNGAANAARCLTATARSMLASRSRCSSGYGERLV